MQEILEITKLNKSFGGVKALDDCSLTIEKGKVTAIIGPNGSGKTTLFNAILNIINKDSGQVYLEKEDISLLMDYEISKRGISRTFQEVRFFKNLTIKEHLEIALSQNDESIFKSIFGKKHNHEEKIKYILGLVGLDKNIETLATDLSYGQRKLLDLAVAIAKPHSLLMLDEPVAGINPVLRQQIKKIIKDLNKQGETILLIEHDMNFVMDLATRIYVLDYGKVIAYGTAKQIQNNKKVLEAYLGE